MGVESRVDNLFSKKAMEGKRPLKNTRNVYSLKCAVWKNSCSQHAKLSLLVLSATHQATTEQLVLFAGNPSVEKVLLIKEFGASS